MRRWVLQAWTEFFAQLCSFMSLLSLVKACICSVITEQRFVIPGFCSGLMFWWVNFSLVHMFFLNQKVQYFVYAGQQFTLISMVCVFPLDWVCWIWIHVYLKMRRSSSVKLSYFGLVVVAPSYIIISNIIHSVKRSQRLGLSHMNSAF